MSHDTYSIDEHRHDTESDASTNTISPIDQLLDRRDYLTFTGTAIAAGLGVTGTAAAASDHSVTDSTGKRAATAARGWPQYQFDSGRSGVVAERQAPTTNFTPAWSIDRRNVGQPVADENAVYVVSAELSGTDPWLKALSRTDGSTRWRVPINSDSRGASRAAPPAVVDGVVYYSSGITTRAFDAATGEQRWASGKTGTWLVIADGRIYLNGANGTFTVLDATDGSVVWERTGWGIGATITAKHAVADGTLYLGVRAADEPYVVALDAATGDHQWTTTPLDADYPHMVATAAGVFAATDTILYALDPATGNIRWQKQGGPLERPEVRNIGRPAVGEEVVYAPVDEKLAAFDIQTGEQRWAADNLHGIAVAGTSLYGLNQYDSELVVRDATTGQRRTRYQYPGKGILDDRTLIPLDDLVLVGRYQYYESEPGTPLVALSGDDTNE